MQFGDGFGQPSVALQKDAKIETGFDEIGGRPRNILQQPDRSPKIAILPQRPGQQITRRQQAGLQPQCFLILLDRLARAALAIERERQVIVSLGKVRPQRERLLKRSLRFRHFPRLGQGHARAIVGNSIGGVECNGGTEVRQSFLRLALPQIGEACLAVAPGFSRACSRRLRGYRNTHSESRNPSSLQSGHNPDGRGTGLFSFPHPDLANFF